MQGPDLLESWPYKGLERSSPAAKIATGQSISDSLRKNTKAARGVLLPAMSSLVAPAGLPPTLAHERSDFYHFEVVRTTASGPRRVNNTTLPVMDTLKDDHCKSRFSVHTHIPGILQKPNDTPISMYTT